MDYFLKSDSSLPTRQWYATFWAATYWDEAWYSKPFLAPDSTSFKDYGPFSFDKMEYLSSFGFFQSASLSTTTGNLDWIYAVLNNRLFSASNLDVLRPLSTCTYCKRKKVQHLYVALFDRCPVECGRTMETKVIYSWPPSLSTVVTALSLSFPKFIVIVLCFSSSASLPFWRDGSRFWRPFR